MSEFLPVLPQQIAEAALDAAEAGAAVVHMHARDPRDGRPSQNPAHFEPILLTLKANTDAVLNGAEIGSGSIVAARTVILEGMVIPWGSPQSVEASAIRSNKMSGKRKYDRECGPDRRRD